VIARCQLHKIRNVRDRLPEKLRTVVERRMRKAYHAETALAAQAELEALAAELDIEASRERRAACARA
jgi:putative transposase